MGMQCWWGKPTPSSYFLVEVRAGVFPLIEAKWEGPQDLEEVQYHTLQICLAIPCLPTFAFRCRHNSTGERCWDFQGGWKREPSEPSTLNGTEGLRGQVKIEARWCWEITRRIVALRRGGGVSQGPGNECLERRWLWIEYQSEVLKWMNKS